MQRYFAEMKDGNIILEQDDIFHIVKVMRNSVGSVIQLVADNKAYEVKITSINPFKFEVIKSLDEDPELDGYIRLLYCLPKGEKLDIVIQKAVELGASEIVLVNSSRCIKKIKKDDYSSKLVRFNKIIKEASEQSKRSNLMKLTDIIDYKDIGKYKADKSFIAYELSDSNISSLYDDFKSIHGKTINILVGSEGGFSAEEVDYAIKCGYKSISLGKRILRSETSCFYVLSLLSFFMESKIWNYSKF